MRRLLCLACSQEFAVEEELYACPGCGNEGIPADMEDRPSFQISWHELRVLVMWAEFWANKQETHSPEDSAKMRRIVYGIADRLHMQHMDGPPLTFSQELSELRAMPGMKVDQNVIEED